MSLIWEVDYTSFSGSSNIAYDNVGSQHLTTYTNLTKVSPAAGFTYRPGISTTVDGANDYYNIASGGSNTTKAWWSDSYSPTSRRSFVCWVYFPSTSTEGSSCVWGDSAATTYADEGINRTNRVLSITLNNTTIFSYTIPGDGFPGWHSIIVTVDRTVPQSKLYVDGILRGTSSSVAATSSMTYRRIGQNNASQEQAMSLGYTATYDHILTSGEVTSIYNTGLVDRLLANPYQSCSGTIYGLSGLPVSGSTVYVIYDTNKQVVSTTTTTASGYYEVDLPYSGSYVLVSDAGLLDGVASVKVLATSSGVFIP